ncbi:hypothetical protein [Haloarcula halophila]|uniref:hypothetical protein n=1 Tax=Haloarcula TaxID=2237 RepID=UPI0023E42E07|nr:hypothetical protein [Halomicroarcula sp. DFY41]
MPLTPFHLGPGLLLGLLLFRYVDMPTVVLGSVLVDWRAALVFGGVWPGPRHDWMHSYLGSLAFAVVLAGVILLVRPSIAEYMRRAKLRQRVSKRTVVLGAVSAVTVHVTIDAFHHPLMEPFLPAGGNPLYGLFTTSEMRLFTAFCLFLGMQLYVAHLVDGVGFSLSGPTE